MQKEGGRGLGRGCKGLHRENRKLGREQQYDARQTDSGCLSDKARLLRPC